CFLIALSGGRIIGMARAVSDRTSDAYLQDVTVAAGRRGKGLGSEIVQRIVARLHEDGLQWIGLIAERGSHPFYERLGFQVMPASLPMLRKEAS
ncbi:MAG: GNAT family N-acetyltransferase, partial [Deltaproteobacteria bacterium]|nr:GNAT family N-acetyltransferase [Deltaproteobacteria bacterium]